MVRVPNNPNKYYIFDSKPEISQNDVTAWELANFVRGMLDKTTEGEVELVYIDVPK